jgi:hypothetical protein
MESVMHPLRRLSPRNHDRIVDLLAKESCDQSLVKKSIPALQLIQIQSQINPISARIKFEKFLDILEHSILKNNGFNMVLRNVPNVAQLSESDEQVTIKHVHMRTTLRQFGNLHEFHMIRGTVYAKFVEPESCARMHALVNNMMMGENIIQTEVVI